MIHGTPNPVVVSVSQVQALTTAQLALKNNSSPVLLCTTSVVFQEACHVHVVSPDIFFASW